MTSRASLRRRRRERTLTALALSALAIVFVVWAAPRASGAVVRWAGPSPVRTVTIWLPGGTLPTAPRVTRTRLSAPSASGATQGAIAPRKTSHAARTAPLTLRAGMRFTMLGLVCDVPVTRGPVTVRLRTSMDGTAWGAWARAPLEVADEAGGPPRAFVELVWTGEARFVQVTASADGAGAPTELTGARLVALDTGARSGAVAALAGVARGLVAVVAGIDLAAPASAATSTPTIVTRAEWGADESLRKGSPTLAPVKMAFIHHSAGGNTYTPEDSPALMRGIYAFHTQNLGWSDIGYNFLIDRFGTVFEGRFGGVANGVVGAQVLGFNNGSTGICMLGTFTAEAPTPEALGALDKLLAWKLATHGLDPAGTATLTCEASAKYEAGAKVTFPVIAGHRDANSTECPGETLYALLPAVREEVARRVNAPVIAQLTAAPTLISPNGDKTLDTTALQVAPGAEADWTVRLRNGAGAVVDSWTGTGAAATITWDGADGAGKRVPDGVYSATLTATSSLSRVVPASAAVTVDTTAPRLASAAAAPSTFSPDSDGQGESASLTYRPAEACAVRVGIKDAGGVVRRWLQGWRDVQAVASTIAWDGKVSNGGGLAPAADGQYRFVVERRDDAGNVARQGFRVTVDRTLGFPTATPATISPDGDGSLDSAVVGFRLTRRARVKIAIRLGTATVRTLDLGSLGAGARAAVWNGRATSGDAVASGRVDVVVTAVSTLGKSSVSGSLVVDLYRPRLYASGDSALALGGAAQLSVKARDPFSDEVDLRYVILDAKGRTFSSRHPGWVPTAQPLGITWRPKARGVYTVTYTATDRGGNTESSPGRTTVTVR